MYGEFYHQLVDVLNDVDTHHSIVSDLHKRSVISEKVFAVQMTSTLERGRSLLTVLGLEEKPHKLRELITVMMEVEKVQPLAEEMTAQLSKVTLTLFALCVCVCVCVCVVCVCVCMCVCDVCVHVYACMCAMCNVYDSTCMVLN